MHIAAFLPISIYAFDDSGRIVLVVLEPIVVDNANPAFTRGAKHDAASREFPPPLLPAVVLDFIISRAT